MHLNKFIDQAAYDAGKYDMDFPAVALVGTNVTYAPDPIIRDYSKEYLTFEALTNGRIFLFVDGGAEIYPAEIYPVIQYSINGDSWANLQASTPAPGTVPDSILVASGDIVRIKGSLSSSLVGDGAFAYFGCSANCNIYGNIKSLQYGDNFEGKTDSVYYPFLFRDCDCLISAEHLVLPSTTVVDDSLYGSYASMFRGCSSLTIAPTIPHVTVTTGSVGNALSGMFASCLSLRKVTCLLQGTGLSLDVWLSGVSATGTFVKAADASWVSGENGIPNGWTVQNAVS